MNNWWLRRAWESRRSIGFIGFLVLFGTNATLEGTAPLAELSRQPLFPPKLVASMVLGQEAGPWRGGSWSSYYDPLAWSWDRRLDHGGDGGSWSSSCWTYDSSRSSLIKPHVVVLKEPPPSHPAYKKVNKLSAMPPKRKRKQKNGEGEAPKKPKEKDIDWKNSAAKNFLKKAFKDGTIPLDYSDTIGPRVVWDDHCKDNPAFVGMLYGNRFTGRLRNVRLDHEKKDNRAEIDKKAFDNFRKNHPRPLEDQNGTPLWDGSKAQRMLKQDMQEGKHKVGAPRELWISQPEYQVYELQVFRDHIYQEERLWKHEYFLELEAAKKMKTIDISNDVIPIDDIPNDDIPNDTN